MTLADDFNPLPPCGGRPYKTALSITELNFNPLPPCGGRQEMLSRIEKAAGISIHSLRVEGDGDTEDLAGALDISIHSLRVEGDQTTSCVVGFSATFQSTPSVWRETRRFATNNRRSCNFNPLPPCGGRPMISQSDVRDYRDFNPLPPCGGRPAQNMQIKINNLFQSTPSVWRETPFLSQLWFPEQKISIHSLRVEGD